MVYQKGTSRLLANPELLKLTNAFVANFFKLYTKLNNNQPNDGYAFNYNLAECLVNSDYLNNNNDNFSCGLMEMGFVQNIINGFFERNLDGFKIDEKINFILKNYKKQDKYEDYRITNYKVTRQPVEVEKFNMDVMLGRCKDPNVPAIYKVTKTETIKSFVLSNSKSGYNGACNVILVGGKPDKIELYSADKKERLLTITTSFGRIEPQIHHYKYVASINSFIHVISQVCFSLEEILSEKQS